ncbi:hypothetical protein [Phaeodactylibacter xiamenensis]|uniref:hypothetical protein n=1 Tax=Phaeodactylibacter xiamenensis TaxID=1524460 RepID=UPI0024A9948A|nr:hypothetical protein [Phaeodactylibacter xiamenensis]
MKTKQILIALLIFGGTTFSNAQKDTVADSRPFLERFYLEGHLGYFLFSDMSYVGLGFVIRPRHYLGFEYVPVLRSYSISTVNTAVDGWGMQYQYRVRKWYFSVSGGVMSKGYHITDDPFIVGPAERRTPFPYYRVAAKHCFWNFLCLGCQIGACGPYKVVAYDETGNGYEWETGVRSLTISLGFLLENSPNTLKKQWRKSN